MWHIWFCIYYIWFCIYEVWHRPRHPQWWNQSPLEGLDGKAPFLGVMKRLLILTSVLLPLVTFADAPHWSIRQNSGILLYVNYIPLERNCGAYSVFCTDLWGEDEILGVWSSRTWEGMWLLNLGAAWSHSCSPGLELTHQFPFLNFHILSVFLQFSSNPGLKYSATLIISSILSWLPSNLWNFLYSLLFFLPSSFFILSQLYFCFTLSNSPLLFFYFFNYSEHWCHIYPQNTLLVKIHLKQEHFW